MTQSDKGFVSPDEKKQEDTSEEGSKTQGGDNSPDNDQKESHKEEL